MGGTNYSASWGVEKRQGEEYNEDMGRRIRVVIPGVPHHVTQRGVRRMPIFFTEGDRESYLRKISGKCREHGVEILCWCLMPNHVHLLVEPSTEDGLSLAIGRAHWAYVKDLNERHGWTGRLFEGRFFSTPMDDSHAMNAVRYVLQNPVRARIATAPGAYRWSSARFHLGLEDTDPLVESPATVDVDDWEAFLACGFADLDEIRSCTRDGRPYGGREFISWIESRTGLDFTERKRGRPRAKK
jgi:putative transposase